MLLDTSGECLRFGAAAGPFLAKPNLLEATEMVRGNSGNSGPQPVGGDLARAVHDLAGRLGALDQMRFFLDHGCELVALSMGPDGLLLASRADAVWARPPQVRVRNSVGAGDALLAGIAWALERRLSTAEMARWGVAAGTASAMQARVGFDHIREVEAILPEVILEIA